MLAAMKPDPATAEQTRQRVLKISRVNGRCVAIVAAICTLVALLLGDWVSAGVSLFVTAGGLLELRGHRQLARGDVAGMRWLVRSQLWELGVICAYAVARLASFDEGLIRELAPPEIQDALKELGTSLEEILPMVRVAFFALYLVLIVATIMYQGGLALYYSRRRGIVARALMDSPTAKGSRY